MTELSATALLVTALGVATLAGVAGYHLARLRQKSSPANERAVEQIRLWRQHETMAGAFVLARTANWEDPAALIGIENCYYSPPDFKRISWVPRDMPTPFVAYAPEPGPLASGFINNMQFRYAREIETPKPPDVIRIFFIGGSVALSVAATSNDTTIGGYLEKYLNEALLGRVGRCEVVTVGACAWTSTHERILIENRLIELHPDVVIAFSGYNDVFWAALGRNILWSRMWQDEYFLILANAGLETNSAPPFRHDVHSGGPLIGPEVGGQRLTRNVDFSHHALATVSADYVFTLQPVLALSRKRRTRREQVVAAAVSARPWIVHAEAFYRHFRADLRALDRPGFHFLDASSIFDACDDQVDLFVDSAHFGDRGNDLIAQHLRDQILPIIDKRLAVRST